jgi:hypothetical protein
MNLFWKTPEHDLLESKLLYILLLRSGQYNFLPDLFDAIDENTEVMTRLLDSFAGTTITFPSTEKIEQYAKEITVYARMKFCKPPDRWSLAEQLAREYTTSGERILQIRDRIGRVLDEAGIRL